MTSKCNTKQYYSNNATEYISNTQSADMSEHYGRFLPYLPDGAKILDVGFGSGRDMLFFASKGYHVVGVDNVPEFVSSAKQKGLDVQLADLHNLTFNQEFDGIWACASLLHSNDLPCAFRNIAKALKVGGHIYLSMKFGSGTSVENGRFFHYIDEQKLRQLCELSQLYIVEIYKSDDLLNRNNGWLNAVITKKLN